METAKEYASIEAHYAGTSDSQHPANYHNSIQKQVWNSKNKQKYTIEGGQIDPRLNGMPIDVKVAELDRGEKSIKVAVTCFEDPHQGVAIQKPGNFPACRRPIVNRVFFLRDDYDEADIVEAIQDEIAREEAAQ